MFKSFFSKRITIPVSKFSYVESITAMGIFIFIGFFIDPQDPLLIKYHAFYVVTLITILTLFHGLISAILCICIAALVFNFGYSEFPTRFFLQLTVLVLIIGQFHYLWAKKQLQNKSVLAYKIAKLDEVSNAFYTLKISHDQIEKNYVFKPMSLRSNVLEIKNSFKDKEDYVKHFLGLLENSFFVTKSELCFVEKGKVYGSGDPTFSKEINVTDLMLKKVLSDKKSVYVNSFTNEQTEYIAVIPALYHSEVKAVLLIKSMPFLAFNRDSLSTISVLFNYFILEQIKWKAIDASIVSGLKYIESPLSKIFDNQSVLLRRKDLDDTFYFELFSLQLIKNDFDVSSTLLILKIADKLVSHLLLENAKKLLRSLDLVTSHTVTNNIVVISLLFPFSDKSSAQGFLTRLLKTVQIEESDSRLLYSMFDVDDLDLPKQFAELKETDVAPKINKTMNDECL